MYIGENKTCLREKAIATVPSRKARFGMSVMRGSIYGVMRGATISTWTGIWPVVLAFIGPDKPWLTGLLSGLDVMAYVTTLSTHKTVVFSFQSSCLHSCWHRSLAPDLDIFWVRRGICLELHPDSGAFPPGDAELPNSLLSLLMSMIVTMALKILPPF